MRCLDFIGGDERSWTCDPWIRNPKKADFPSNAKNKNLLINLWL